MGASPAEPVPLGLRERHKHTTRRTLEDAALRLFARDGFDATSVEAIAAAADVSPRTFFRYFAAKDDVLNPEREQRQAQLRAEVLALGLTGEGGEGGPGVSDLEVARRAFVALAPGFEEERESMLLRRRAAASSPLLRGRLYDVMHSWQVTLTEALAERRGVAADDVGVETCAAVAVAAWQSALARWLRDDSAEHRPPHDLVAHLEETFGSVASLRP